MRIQGRAERSETRGFVNECEVMDERRRGFCECLRLQQVVESTRKSHFISMGN